MKQNKSLPSDDFQELFVDFPDDNLLIFPIRLFLEVFNERILFSYSKNVVLRLFSISTFSTPLRHPKNEKSIVKNDKENEYP